MGWAICFGPCFACGKNFGFNPNKVPSIRDPKTNKKEPVCRECIERANVIREEKGMDPLTYHSDAYEPIPEEQL